MEDRIWIPYAVLSDEQRAQVDSPHWFDRKDAASQGYGLDKLVDDEHGYVREAVAKQGYGLDKLVNDVYDDVDYEARSYLRNNYYSTLERWIELNPDRCALPKNKPPTSPFNFPHPNEFKQVAADVFLWQLGISIIELRKCDDIWVVKSFLVLAPAELALTLWHTGTSFEDIYRHCFEKNANDVLVNKPTMEFVISNPDNPAIPFKSIEDALREAKPNYQTAKSQTSERVDAPNIAHSTISAPTQKR